MGKVKFDVGISLDGFLAGPNARFEEPLGDAGEKLHEWMFKTAVWQEAHGGEGGATGRDDDVVRESTENTGAYLMGRQMFGGGEGDWGDGSWKGWWGDDPPYHVPVFVLTHHPRAQVEMRGGTSFIFVTDGFESALEQARAAAEDQDVSVAGGAEVIQEALALGCLDEIQVHVVPLLLGDGTRLFGEGQLKRLKQARVIDSPAVTHIRYRVG